ncbi:MAG: class I SAM-dependent methyltransferase, partial [Planctomycetota bacterium]
MSSNDTACKCPVCSSDDSEAFFSFQQAPTHIGILWPSREAALGCKKGDIELHFCKRCGHVFNPLFDENLLDYSEEYDNALEFSAVFREYLDGVAKDLVARYGIQGKHVVEVGCGKGDFLMRLAQAGGNTGAGFDVSYDGRQDEAAEKLGVKFFREFYTEKHKDQNPDVLCSRFVYEHIPDPIAFLRGIRETLGDREDVVVYFEVPNMGLTLRQLSVWDVIYEHCAHFTAPSLEYAFRAAGFNVHRVDEKYNEQILAIEASPAIGEVAESETLAADVATIAGHVNTFKGGVGERFDTWKQEMENLQGSGKNAVLWGGGARGVSYLTMLGLDREIQCVVDI